MSTPFYENYDPPEPMRNPERVEMSINSREPCGIQIMASSGTIVDPDNITVTVKVNPYGSGQDDFEIESIEPTKENIGIYSVILPYQATGQPGEIDILWDYTIDSEAFRATNYIYVSHAMPTFDSLSPALKQVVQQVRWKIADLFDNSRGGLPNFSEEWQVNFGNERIAQMMILAIGRLNAKIQTPPYSVDNFPTKYSAVLVLSTWVEVVQHFIRTYVEQPTVSGQQVAMVDRRDYMSRWDTVLKSAKEDAKDAEQNFVYSHLGLGGGALLVSGGNYGHTSPYFSRSMAARSVRMYPAAHTIVRYR